jgi:hypothetical protein
LVNIEHPTNMIVPASDVDQNAAVRRLQARLPLYQDSKCRSTNK